METAPKNVLDNIDGACAEYLQLNVFSKWIMGLATSNICTTSLSGTILLEIPLDGYLLFFLIVVLKLTRIVDDAWAYCQ